MRLIRLWRVREVLLTDGRWTIDILVLLVVAADAFTLYRVALAIGVIG